MNNGACLDRLFQINIRGVDQWYRGSKVSMLFLCKYDANRIRPAGQNKYMNGKLLHELHT